MCFGGGDSPAPTYNSNVTTPAYAPEDAWKAVTVTQEPDTGSTRTAEKLPASAGSTNNPQSIDPTLTGITLKGM